MNKQLRNIIRRSIDLHVHIGPEIVPRKFVAGELTQNQRGKIAGMVLKNHFYPTTPLIPDSFIVPKLFGSITLNNFVGGINPEAVYGASLVTKKTLVVWFPTISAENFLENSKFEIAPEWVNKPQFRARNAKSIMGLSVIDVKGKITNNALSVLKVIKQTNAILATGHISASESLVLVKAARSFGIRKIIVTHPIYQRIGMSPDVQKDLIKMGAKIEHCFSMYSIDKIPMKKIASGIQQVGVGNCVVSSDVGQKYSPPPNEALYNFGELLVKNNLKLEDLETMMVTNPLKLVS